MSDLIRVGEGHYTRMRKLPADHQEAIRTVLRQMRKVIYRTRIRGEKK